MEIEKPIINNCQKYLSRWLVDKNRKGVMPRAEFSSPGQIQYICNKNLKEFIHIFVTKITNSRDYTVYQFLYKSTRN